MADGVNPVDTGQPMTLGELEADEDDHKEQISNNTLPTEGHRSRQFLPDNGPEVKNAAVDSKMKDIQCREIGAMSTKDVRSIAATIAEHPDEHSTTVMWATAVRAFWTARPNGEPQLQQLQQPSALHQVQGVGNTTPGWSGRQGIEQRQELAHVECQIEFSGFDDLDDRKDEPCVD